MMRLAAVDTSSMQGSLALLQQDGAGGVAVVREHRSANPGSHATQILRALEQLLDEAGWARTSVDAFAATRGPGSFTGIRVGLGTVRGLALAASRPAFGVGTLEAMAGTVVEPTLERVPLLAAGRGEVFGARYDASSEPPRQIIAPWVGPVERAIDPARPEAAIFGTGAIEYLERLRAAGFRGVLASAATTVAGSAGKLALLQIARGALDGDGLAPLYVRPPDAVARPDGLRPA